MNTIALLIGAAILVAVVVLLVQLNKKVKIQTDELEKTRQCLEQMESTEIPKADVVAEETAQPEPQVISEVLTEPIIEERQDVEAEVENQPEASTYNTGKSGKVYTKEELELLIRE